MQKLEQKIIETRAASPLALIGAEIAPDGDAIRFYPVSLDERTGAEIEISGGFVWSEIGWYKGDYNRAEAYADRVHRRSK